MSAHGVGTLNTHQRRVLVPGLSDTQVRYRLWEYLEARKTTPGALVLVHEWTTRWRLTTADRKRWRRIMANTIADVTREDG